MEVIDIASTDVSGLNILPRSAMAYSAKILGMHVGCRRLSAIVYVAKGRYEYSWNGGWASVCQGGIIYIPKGGCYSYEVEAGERFVCQIEFDTFCKGAECVFSEHPVLFRGEVGINDFMMSLVTARDGFRMVSGLFRLFGMMADAAKSDGASLRRIAPAVGYIEEHYAEEITSDTLAAVCYLSKSQMRRLFSAELGKTPSEYRAEVRIKKACALLSGSFESIATVASAVGYDSQFAFSKAFRKLVGVPPTEFAGAARRSVRTSTG